MAVKRETGWLYKRAANGKIRVWCAEVVVDDSDVYYVAKSGYDGGVITTHETKMTSSAMMTAYECAESKMNSAKESKLSSGYCVTREDAEAYVPTKPMLIHKFDTNSNKLLYPVFVQPKLDGVCALYRDDPKNPRFDSRENNEFVKLKPYAMEIFQYLNDIHGESRKYMNSHGEIYAHGRHVSEIVEALKGDNEEVFNELKFYIFDYIWTDDTYEKQTYLERLHDGSKFYDWDNPKRPYVPIQTLTALDESHVLAHKDAFIKAGFEGVVASDPNGLYAYETRSYAKLKAKDLISQEFEITGFDVEYNGDTELIMFKLVTEKGVQFTARPAWKHSERATAYKVGSSYIGKKATVEFRSWTKYGTPFHGVLTVIRDYE